MDSNIVYIGYYKKYLISAKVFFILFLLFRGIFDMSSQDLQPGQTMHSYWTNKMESSNSKKISPEHLRKKILEEDKKKRQRLLFITCFIIALILAVITLLALKSNLIQDPFLINNIDLLSNNEEINFYNKMEFYQWLDLAVAEQAQ